MVVMTIRITTMMTTTTMDMIMLVSLMIDGRRDCGCNYDYENDDDNIDDDDVDRIMAIMK